MDEYSVKRAGNGLVTPRRGLRETADSKDKNVQYCSRLGCSGRVNYTKSTRVGGMKPRPLRPTFGSSNGKEVVGSSSMTSSGITSARSSRKESQRKSSSNIENKLSATRSLNEEPEVLKQLQSLTEHQFQFDSAKRDTGSSKVLFAEVGCSSGTSSSRPRKIFGHGPGSSNQKSPMDSSVSSSSKSISAGTKGSSSGEGYRLRNLKCNSVSDVLPISCSPSESSISRRFSWFFSFGNRNNWYQSHRFQPSLSPHYESMVESAEIDFQRIGRLLQTFCAKLNRQFDQFKARQARLMLVMEENFHRTEQLTARLEAQSMHQCFNPNPYSIDEYYRGDWHLYYYQVPNQVDNTNSGFYYVQFSDGSTVSMTVAQLDNLLKSSYEYFENKILEVDYPCIVPPFALTRVAAGNIINERIILIRTESDSSIKQLKNWVEDVPM